MPESATPRPSWIDMFRAVPARVRWLIYLSSPSGVAYGYLYIFISSYMLDLGLTSSDVGILLGLTGASSVICAIPIGILSDRKGRKWFFIGGLALIPPSLLVFAATTDMLYLSIASIVLGIGEGAFMGTWNALIADQTDVETRNSAFSLSFVISNVFFALGFVLPLIFPWIESTTGWDSMTVHTGAIVVLALAAFVSPVGEWLLLRGYTERMRERVKAVKRKSMKMLYKFSGINALIGLGAGFIIPLIPTWLLLKFGVEDEISGPLLGLSNLTIGLAGIVSALVARKYGMVRAIVLTTSLSTVFMFSLAFVSNAALAAGLYLVRAALMNMSSPIMDSFLMGIVIKEDRGLASAVNSIFWRLPNSVSTIAGGWLLYEGYYDIPFFLATGFYVASISLFYGVFRNVKPTE